MYSQANIVSFDAARRRATAQQRSGSSRPAPVRGDRAGAARRDGVVSEVRYRDAGAGAGAAGRWSGGGAAAAAVRFPRDAAATPTRGRASSRAEFAAASPSSRRDRAAARDVAPRAAVERFDEEEEPSQGEGGFLSRLREGRRARTKERAGRAYFQQYEAGKASDASQGGPRAAVYKGEMGSAHKRSARMQQEGSASRASRRGFAAASSKRVDLRAPLMALGACALCAVFAFALLYGPAQQFYHDLRQKDRLAAEYTAVVERNEAISKQVDSLQTDEGIEDQARTELGWVKEGEHAVSVAGLEDKHESTFRGNIVSEDIPYPETWYSSIFDPLFGVADE